MKFRHTFCNFFMGPCCAKKINTRTFICCFPQVRRHVHKKITKTTYRLEKPGCFVFGKPVFSSLNLGLTTPYSLGILVWNFYQTLVIVSIEFWVRSEPHIHPTRFGIILFIHLCQGWKECSFMCQTVLFFSSVNTHSFDLKFVAFSLKFSQHCNMEF